MGEIVVIKRKVVRSSEKKKALPNMEFDRITWAIKGRSFDSDRANICRIKIEPNKVIATNGHVLFIADTEGVYPDGVYEVLFASWRLIVLEKQDYEYPAYEKVIEFSKPINKVVEFYTSGTDGIDAFAYHALRLDAFALKYIQLAYIPYENIKMEWRDSMTALVVSAPKRTALIMPMILSGGASC